MRLRLVASAGLLAAFVVLADCSVNDVPATTSSDAGKDAPIGDGGVDSPPPDGGLPPCKFDQAASTFGNCTFGN